MDISAVNNTGGDVFDIHVVIIGTGGTIHNLVAISPALQALNAGPGNEVNGSWTAGLLNGNTWEAKFDVDFLPLAVDTANWTDASHNDIAPIAPGDVHLAAVPELSSRMLWAGGLILLGFWRLPTQFPESVIRRPSRLFNQVI
jgi:hypothetical protein